MSYRPITDVWILGRPKVGYYGAYPSGFLERARALLGVTVDDPVLHVCGGRAREYTSTKAGEVCRRGFGLHDRTLDLDPNLQPDFLQAATDPLPCPRHHSGVDVCDRTTARSDELCRWPALIADPPYTEADAAKYAPGAKAFPSANRILRNMLDAVRPGGRVGMLHYIVPSPPSREAKRNPVPYDVRFVALVSVWCGYNNRGRLFSVFEREA